MPIFYKIENTESSFWHKTLDLIKDWIIFIFSLDSEDPKLNPL